MNKNPQPPNRFHRSEARPCDFVPTNHAEFVCQNIALRLGEKDMRFVLARLHQLNGNLYPLELAFSAVKEQMRAGKARNPRGLFNHLVSKACSTLATHRI
jgi:hypothetical protein